MAHKVQEEREAPTLVAKRRVAAMKAFSAESRKQAQTYAQEHTALPQTMQHGGKVPEATAHRLQVSYLTSVQLPGTVVRSMGRCLL